MAEPGISRKIFAAQLTTDAFVTLATIWDAASVKEKIIQLTNSASGNGINYQIHGSVDGVNFTSIVASTLIASAGTADARITDYWPEIRIQIQAAGAGNQSTVNAEGAGVRA